MLHYCRSITASSALLFLALPILSFTLISSSLNLESLCLLREIDTGSRLVFPYEHSREKPWNHLQIRRYLASQATSDFAAEVPHLLTAKPTNSSLILAAGRTRRKDPLNHFKLYTGGWNITNRHYLASVGFTAAPLFTASLVWFIVFGTALLWICVCYFYLRKKFQAFPSKVYTVALAILVFCTLSAIAGSILLYLGQGNFHQSTVETFDYIVSQANITVENLRNVSDYLLAASDIDVISAILPPAVQKSIEGVVESKLNASSNKLGSQTMNNAHRIKSVLASMGVSIAIIAAFMLVVALLGLLCSFVVSCQRPLVIYSLVVVGWLLISGTLICSGIFHLLHNAIGDTCVAMDEWVRNPMAHTALDDIIPCVDKAAAEETLLRSKDATYQIVNEMNGVITNISNKDIAPSVGPPAYFNQSGPLVPIFCNPFDSDLSNRSCAAGEVDYDDATKVWKNYTCNVSSNGVCTSSGRLTPKFYTQLAAAVNVSYGLYHYGPFLVSLQDCSFIYQTFTNISSNHCPELKKYTQWIYSGAVLLAVSVMFLVICWPVLTQRQEGSISS